MKQRSAGGPQSASLALPLGGCADGIEGLAAGLVGLAGLFVLLLFAVPPILRYLDHREHRERMRNRRPWSEDAARRRAERRREADAE